MPIRPGIVAGTFAKELTSGIDLRTPRLDREKQRNEEARQQLVLNKQAGDRSMAAQDRLEYGDKQRAAYAKEQREIETHALKMAEGQQRLQERQTPENTPARSPAAEFGIVPDISPIEEVPFTDFHAELMKDPREALAFADASGNTKLKHLEDARKASLRDWEERASLYLQQTIGKYQEFGVLDDQQVEQFTVGLQSVQGPDDYAALNQSVKGAKNAYVARQAADRHRDAVTRELTDVMGRTPSGSPQRMEVQQRLARIKDDPDITPAQMSELRAEAIVEADLDLQSLIQSKMQQAMQQFAGSNQVQFSQPAEVPGFSGSPRDRVQAIPKEELGGLMDALIGAKDEEAATEILGQYGLRYSKNTLGLIRKAYKGIGVSQRPNRNPSR